MCVTTGDGVAANDNCADATSVNPLPFTAVGNTVGATTDFDATVCTIDPADVGIWYEMTGTDKIVEVTITSSTFNSRLVVFQGADCASQTCFLNSDGSGFDNYLSWAAPSSETYRILVNGISASAGTFNIGISDLERPGNDSCQTATQISSIPSSIGGDSTGSFVDFETLTCNVGPEDRGVWFKFTAPEDNIIELEVLNANFNNRLVVFTGTCDQLSCFANHDGSGTGSFLSWQGIANTEYLVLVTGVSGFADVGTFTLEVTALARPDNDSCETAIKIPTIPLSVGGDSTGSYTDFDTSLCAVAPTNRGIWYNFTALEDKILELRVSSATFNNRLVVFTGTCSVLSCFANHDGSGTSSFLSWQGVANTEYLVLVTGVSEFFDVGTFTLGVSALERPPNDECQTATLISSNASLLDDSTGSFTDFSNLECSVQPTNRGIWYAFEGETGSVDIEITDATFNVNLVAFSGDCNLKACIGNNDGSGTAAFLSLPTVAGTPYKILVTGVSGFTDVGTYNIKFSGSISATSTVAPVLTEPPTTEPPTTLPTVSPSAMPSLRPSSTETAMPSLVESETAPPTTLPTVSPSAMTSFRPSTETAMPSLIESKTNPSSIEAPTSSFATHSFSPSGGPLFGLIIPMTALLFLH